MTAALILYTHPMSAGRIVRWALEEICTPYRVVALDPDTTMKAPDYLALNPMGKVPALRHGEVVVTECAAICAYLADAFPEAGLAPPIGHPDRGAWYRWLFFAAGPLDTATCLAAMGIDTPRHLESVAAWGSLERVVDVIADTLEHRTWFVSNRFSAVDIHLGTLLDWGIAFGPIAPRPVFEDYIGRLHDRPAWRRATLLDDALATGRKLALVR